VWNLEFRGEKTLPSKLSHYFPSPLAGDAYACFAEWGGGEPNRQCTPIFVRLSADVMTWQKRKLIRVFAWLLVILLCLSSPSWSQKISSNQLKDNLREAEKSYSAKDYSKAEEFFVNLSESFPRDSRYSYFQFMIAKCEYHLKNYSSAQDKFKEFIQKFPRSRFMPACFFMLGNINYLRGEKLESAQNFIQAYQLAKTEQLRTLSQRSLEPLLERWLSERELEKLSQEEKDTKLAPKIFFRLGKRSLERGNYTKAMEALNYYRDNFPKGEDIKEVNLLLKEKKPSPIQTVKVGVLAPLTGDFSIHGNSFSKGIQLALSSYHSPKRAVELVVKDDAGDPLKAEQFCEELIEEDDVVCVLGPLKSESVVKAATVTERWIVPLITPVATQKGLSSSTNFVFQLTPSPERKAKSMAEFLIRNQKFSDFAMLIPEGGQNKTEALSFKEAVEKEGGKMMAVAYYPPGTDDFSLYIKRIKSALLGVNPSTLPEESGSFFDQMPARVDGFFISADEKDMYTILSSLANFKIYTAVIGMGWWGDQQLLALAQSLHQEMIFTADEQPQQNESKTVFAGTERENFLKLYYEQYKSVLDRSAFGGKGPDQLFMLGYDAMKLLLSFFSTGSTGEDVTSPEQIMTALLSTVDFKGASGEIRFDSQGENIYIPVYKVENGQIKRLW
jgi:ABC-type branched-subunit amino acid transport system substrate-binding protein